MGFVINTDRLQLTELSESDVEFVYALFNDPDCLRFMGDRGINDLSGAETYLKDRLIQSYRAHGFGLYKVTAQGSSEPMGISGLVKRDETSPPDIGFAFLPKFRSGGFCTEAAQAVLDWAKSNQVSDTILAYTNPDNRASIRVLEKIGLQQQTITTLPGQDFQSLILSINMSQTD